MDGKEGKKGGKGSKKGPGERAGELSEAERGEEEPETTKRARRKEAGAAFLPSFLPSLPLPRTLPSGREVAPPTCRRPTRAADVGFGTIWRGDIDVDAAAAADAAEDDAAPPPVEGAA